MTTPASRQCPPWLAQHLRAHRDRHGPHYQGFLSDHLPMALLAMHATGGGRASLESYASTYKKRLDPPVQHSTETPDTYTTVQGDLTAYGSLLNYFDREIARQGIQATLATCLPGLISGWVRFAFHPIIRLAYGIRFGVESEISAGLAYLCCAGPDDRLQALAETATHCDEFALPTASRDVIEAPFEKRYNATVDSGDLTGCITVVPDNQRTLAELALALFNHTHDFFALHVVTGIHALGICAEAIDLDVDSLMSAGVLAAYLTIGAPDFDPEARPTSTNIDDEHDAKLAFTCHDQAKRLNSTPFAAAAAAYSS